MDDAKSGINARFDGVFSQQTGTERVNGGNPVLVERLSGLFDSTLKPLILRTQSRKFFLQATDLLINTALHLLSCFLSEGQSENFWQGDSIIGQQDKAETMTED